MPHILLAIAKTDQLLNIKWIDSLFVNLLKIIAIPLIFCALVNAIVSIRNSKCINRIWIYTGCYVLLSVSIAVIIGLVLSNYFQPGSGIPDKLISSHHQSSSIETLNYSSPFFNAMLPLDKINMVSNFEFIPIIIFGIIFGIACISIGQSADPLILIFIAIRNVFNKIIKWFMYLTPVALFGVFGSLLAEAYSKHILKESIRGLSLFVGILILGLIFQFLWQLIIIRLIFKKDTLQFLQRGKKALVVAFETSNSSATLPTTLSVAKEQHIHNDIANFVLPFTIVLNVAGTAMYEAVSALFFAQILNIHLSLLSQIGVFFIAIIAGVGAGGIPEGGLITMFIVLKSINVPTSAIALLLPFDRILDRLRTMVNVWGDLVCATAVDYFISKEN